MNIYLVTTLSIFLIYTGSVLAQQQVDSSQRAAVQNHANANNENLAGKPIGPPSLELAELLAAQKAVEQALTLGGDAGKTVLESLHLVRKISSDYHRQLSQHSALAELNHERKVILAKLGEALRAGEIEKAKVSETELRSLAEKIKTEASRIPEIESLRQQIHSNRDLFLKKRAEFFQSTEERLMILKRLENAERVVSEKRKANSVAPVAP